MWLQVQLLDLAWQRGVVQNAAYGPAHNTKRTRRAAMDVVNDVGNLNVTSHVVNQKKKGFVPRKLPACLYFGLVKHHPCTNTNDLDTRE